MAFARGMAVFFGRGLAVVTLAGAFGFDEAGSTRAFFEAEPACSRSVGSCKAFRRRSCGTLA